MNLGEHESDEAAFSHCARFPLTPALSRGEREKFCRDGGIVKSPRLNSAWEFIVRSFA